MKTFQRKIRNFSGTSFHGLGLLIILYTLQGIPMGLSAALPYILQGKISYSEQAILSLLSLPFSMKLLWAPLVDTVYSNKFGRRKTWLIPTQLLSAILMIWGSYSGSISKWLGESTIKQPNVSALLLYFGFLYFLMATQDIVVDGWSLTMLPPHYIEYSSTCNSIGQMFGYYSAFIGYMILSDPIYCNKYFRRTPSSIGLINFSSLVRFSGWLFLIITLCVLAFKKEEFSELLNPTSLRSPKAATSPKELQDIVLHGSISENEIVKRPYISYKSKLTHSYSILWHMLSITPFRHLLVILLTCRIAFGVTDAGTQLKIVEFGLPKETIALFLPFLLPASAISTILVSRLCVSTRAMIVFQWAIPLRLVICVVWMGLLKITQNTFQNSLTSQTPQWYYILVFFVFCLHTFANDLMHVAQMTFFAKVSDPKFGGSYMTFLNTTANFGSKWPQTVMLSLLDSFTIRRCLNANATDIINGSTLSCKVFIDGYYVLGFLSLLVGAMWIYFFQPLLLKIDATRKEEWLLSWKEN